VVGDLVQAPPPKLYDFPPRTIALRRRRWKLCPGRSVLGGVAAAVAVCAMLSGCSARRQWAPVDLVGTVADFDALPRLGQNLLSSPIIIVCNVTSNIPLGPPIDAALHPGYKVELHRVSCEIELPERGPFAQGATVGFFYYSDSGLPSAAPDAFDGYYKRNLLFAAESGRRYIFFLTGHGDRLRTIGDVGPFSVEVSSGRHTSMRMMANEESDIRALSPEDTLVDVLLVPGEGFSAETFSRNLPKASRAAEQLGGRLRVVRRLRQLLKRPSPVGRAACEALAELSLADYRCLQGALTDQDLSADARKQTESRLDWYRFQESGMLRQLQAILRFGLGSSPFGDRLSVNKEELEVLLGSPNKTMADLSRKILGRCFAEREPQERP
jgi:hypothetical protein